MTRLLRHAARRQAERMVAAIEQALPCNADDLRHDALATLEAIAGIQLRMVPDADTDQGCSVAGAYIDTPPTIAVATSTSAGRRAFTALHELGHHLQRNHLSLMEELLKQPDHGVALEDEACNSFAGLILLPDEAAADHFSDRGPTAPDVVALWEASNASRAAVCVRAVEHLPAPGHVILLEADGRVSFAASRGLPPLRRNSDQSTAEVIGAALGRSPMRGRGRTRLAYRNGITGDELYVQVAEMNGYAVAVLVVDHAPWETFSPPSVDTGPQGREWICARCDDEFVSYSAPCARCDSPTCPTCERCACTGGPTPDRMCDTCTLMQPATMYEPGGTTCADCR